MMNRREFGKLCASVLAAPAALAVLPKKKGLMVADIVKIRDKMKENDENFVYRGFKVRWMDWQGIKRGHITNDRYHIAVDSLDDSFGEFWIRYRPSLDAAIDRHERKIAY